MFMNLLNVGKELERGAKEFEQREKEQKESKARFDREFAEMKQGFKEMEANTNIGSFDNLLYGFRFGK